MARLLENQSKDLLNQLGIPVPRYGIASCQAVAIEMAKEIGFPVVLKALIPLGKRGKSGAIKFASTMEEVSIMSAELLTMTVSHYPVESILIEQKIDIHRELYLSISLDKVEQKPIIIASAVGGVDIEEISKLQPEKIITLHVDPLIGLADYQCRQIWHDAGLTGKLLQTVGAVTKRLYQAFEDYDSVLLEINPLVVTGDSNVVAAAAMMSIDDNALYRHTELLGQVQMGTERAWRPLTELEKQVVSVNEADPYRGTARYTEMDGGDIGFMCGGGGASLLMFDAILHAGGQPANYSEVGGNPSEEKVYGLTKGILSKHGVRGLFVAQNITNNTQVDLVAKGVIRAIKERNIDPDIFPIVVRGAGINEDIAKDLLQSNRIEYYGDNITLTAAAQRMVALMEATLIKAAQQEVV